MNFMVMYNLFIDFSQCRYIEFGTVGTINRSRGTEEVLLHKNQHHKIFNLEVKELSTIKIK